MCIYISVEGQKPHEWYLCSRIPTKMGGGVITTIALNDKYRINLVFDDKSITLMKHFNCISGDQVSMFLFCMFVPGYIHVV